jgi:hypothetical protein
MRLRALLLTRGEAAETQSEHFLVGGRVQVSVHPGSGLEGVSSSLLASDLCFVLLLGLRKERPEQLPGLVHGDIHQLGGEAQLLETRL